MIPQRYPAPGAAAIFNDNTKIDRWKRITDAYAHALIDEVAPDHPEIAHEALVNTSAPSLEMIAEYEAETGHDVVAFLAAYATKLGEGVKSYIHLGLTSSDLVEYGLFQSLSEHADSISRMSATLQGQMQRWRFENIIRPGRTHGQLADHTTWSHQMMVLATTLEEIRRGLVDYAERANVVKIPGPTGWAGGNPALVVRASQVANDLGCRLSVATQVINRDLLLQWACLYLRLACTMENLALQVRLAARAEVAEVREGATRVGSSAMPHKRNPIDSEKVCGLARVARGYFMSISEDVALWEDRDLSNSSLERIAVPDLAAVVEHMVITMTKVMSNLQVDREQMEGNATSPQCRSNVMQVVAQELFDLGPVEASALIREGISHNPNMPISWVDDIAYVIEERGMDARGWVQEVEKRVNQRFPTHTSTIPDELWEQERQTYLQEQDS